MTELERELRERPVARYSLGPTLNTSTLVIMALAITPFVVLPRIFPRFLYGPLGAMVAAAIVGGGVLVGLAVLKLARGANVRWLEGALTRLRLDRASYLAMLENGAFAATVVVTLELDGGDPPSPDLRGLPGTTVEVRPGTLRITSPSLSTSSFSIFGPRPHNGKLHRWFRACADTVITPLAATRTVRTVRTELARA